MAQTALKCHACLISKGNRCTMSRNLVLKAATVLFLLLGLTRYLSHMPHIFDVALDDELVYMGVGTDFDHLILWPPSFRGVYSSYENGGLYSGIYGWFSLFFADPIDLYIYGGMAIVVLAVLFGFISCLLLSDSFLVATAIASPVVLSGELLTWPRVSFGAIAIIALGFASVARVSSFRIKVALLLCAAYLAAFIRPEFVLSFYIFLVLQLGILVELPLRRRRMARGVPPVTSQELAAIGMASAFIVAMSFIWSFPVLQGSERAFVAFGAHYAMQYAAAHKLDIDAWIDWRLVITDQFPGAHTVFEAVRGQPGKMLLYFVGNLYELGASIGQILLSTMRQHIVFSIVWLLCVVSWGAPALYRRNDVVATIWSPQRRRLMHIGCALVFGLPPLIATVTIFPRHHYIVLLLFMFSSAIAAFTGSRPSRLSPILALGLAVAFLFSAEPLPVVPQPMLETVLKLRKQPPIHRMFEIDGGWCYLMIPRCREEYAEWVPDTMSFDTYRREHGIDAVVLSEKLRKFEAVHNANFPKEIEQLKALEGWQSTDLGHGYVLLRPPS